MLNAIIRFSIKNKLIIGLLIIAWICWGVIEMLRLPIDALPDITSNQVQVITTAPTLAAPEVERLITFPVEQVVSNIPNIREIRSISRFGLSVITIVFSDGTDLYRSRQQVAERIALVRDAIPGEAGQPEMAPVTTGLGEIYQYVVRPKKGFEGRYTNGDLRSIQDWIIRRQLLGTEGVADVSSFGGSLRQYEVAVYPAKLNSMGVSIAEVFAALEANNQNSGGSYIEKGPSVLFIRTEGLASGIEDIRNIPVKRTTSGAPVFIRDLAEVRIGSAVRYGAMTYGTEGEVTGAVVMMLKGENASKVITNIKERMEIIRSTLPEGVEVETFVDRTKMVNRAIGTVKRNLIEGALIVVFVLVIFLGNLRAGLIVASVIPLAMLFAVVMMNMFGVSGNLMSLGALDFGLIVDGAVIIVEAVMHRIYHGHILEKQVQLSREQMDEAVEDSASRMMNAAVFGQIIILIVYLPILSLTGIEGKMFRPMAQTVAFALAGAFILSITYVPMMTALVMSRKLRQQENLSDRMIRFLQGIYEKTLLKALAFPKTIVAIALVLLAFSVLIASRLGGEFIPQLEEGDFAIDARINTGSSLATSVETAGRAAAILKTFPEVTKVVCRIGSSEIPTDPMPMEMMDVMVSLKEKDEWTSATTVSELANKMSKALAAIPNMSAGFQYPVQMRFNELIAGARQDVVCKIFGEDLDSLARYGQQLSSIIRGVDGAKDIYLETLTGLPQIVVRYKRDMMAIHELSVKDVNRVIRAAFAGDVAGKVYENERRYDLVVRMANPLRKDISDVRQLLLPTPAGIQVPLEQVADVSIQEGPNQIQREDAKRRIIVGFNTRGRDVQSIVNEVQAKAERKLNLSAGYYIKYGGQFENLVEAKKRLSIAVPIALGLIFMMLYFAFGSVRYGLLIFSAIPLSAIGGILFLWIRDMPFSISAGVGFIALFGVAVLNGIVLISEFNRLKKAGNIDIRSIILYGTRVRLRPVLMTAAVASLGFLPMAVSHGAGAEVQRPLATVVIGGLVTATLLTLLMLPVLYQWFEKLPAANHGKRFTMIAILVFSASMAAKAQLPEGMPVTLDTLLQRAARGNLGLQAMQKNSEYWKVLGERTFELPPTLIGAEFGNINSVNNDNRLSVAQNFHMPSVYSRQKEYYQAGRKASLSALSLRGRELDREIRLEYYLLSEMLERHLMLRQLDSIYGRYEYAAALRYKTGETNLLEKTNATLLLGQLQLQRIQLEADIRIQQQRLGALLNSNERMLPAANAEDPVLLQPVADTAALSGHPLLGYYRGQLGLTLAQGQLDRSKMSPTIGVGYSNLSMVGWQSPDGVSQKYYGSGQRFHTFNLTMGIPLLNGAVRSKLKAGEVSGESVRLQEASARRQLQGQLAQLQEEYLKAAGQLMYYREKGLPQSDLILSQARIAYEKGELSYIDRNVLMNQAIQIRLNYLDALHAWHVALANHYYLTGK